MKITDVPIRALYTGFPPKGLIVGLRVEYIEDVENEFSMTSFDIRFSLPGEPRFSEKYLKEIISKFKELLCISKYNNEYYISNLYGTGLLLNIKQYINQEDALNLICGICKNILQYSTDEIRYHDKIQERISWYVNLITKYNQYEYTETKIVHTPSNEMDVNLDEMIEI